jgi:hypothetical protein
VVLEVDRFPHADEWFEWLLNTLLNDELSAYEEFDAYIGNLADTEGFILDPEAGRWIDHRLFDHDLT